MGFTDFFTDVWETFAQPSPDAEAPPQGGSSTRSPASGTDEESSEEAEVNKKDAADKSGSQEQGHKPSSKPSDEDEEDAAPEEDEEDEEEPDPKERLEKGESTCRIILGAFSLSVPACKLHVELDERVVIPAHHIIHACYAIA